LSEVCYIDWHVNPWRSDQWFEAWEPAVKRALAFGAKSSTVTRSQEDPLLFRQTSVWEDRADFERYWYSDEITAIREKAMRLYNKPLLPAWHSVVAET
jgi:hypothetical protein